MEERIILIGYGRDLLLSIFWLRRICKKQVMKVLHVSEFLWGQKLSKIYRKDI